MYTHVITYASHSERNYQNMIDNEYNIKIKTLGWGKKWKALNNKIRLLYNEIKNYDDNDIVISLDGFDVWINGYLDKAIKAFKDTNSKVLFSLDMKQKLNPNFFQKISNLLVKKPWRSQGGGINGITLNSGIYMGYVKYLKIILNEAINKKCISDQVIFNRLCSKYKFISIDYEKNIFENVYSVNDVKKSNAVFVQVPGNFSILGLSLIKRFFYTYFQFYFLESLICLCIFCYLLFIKKKFIPMYLLIIIYLILVIYANKSCL